MKKLLLLFFVTLVSVTTEAQIFTQVIDEQELQFKVKLIDEFFRRFNYETDYKGESIVEQPDSIPIDTVVKRKNLMTLFNLDTFMDSHKEMDSISTEFLDYVIRNDKKIHYADTTWYAEAVSSVIMDGKSYPIKIFLHTEQIKDVIYKWVITDVESSLFSNLVDSVDLKISIMPGAHGSSFITLPETINLNAKSVRSLFSKNYKPCVLTVFDYLISKGKLKMQNITKVIYHFQLDAYEFTVERFEKEKSYNKGWLISKIVKQNK